MAHVHTAPGQIDFTVSVYVVCGDRVLYRFHDKVHKWLVPGGHIELDEVPEQAALREVYEEVGLEVRLYNPENLSLVGRTDEASRVGIRDSKELLVPAFIEIHPLPVVEGTHRHIDSIFFAQAENMDVHEPDGKEKSGGILWLTKEEVLDHPDIEPLMKKYGLKALEVLAS
jgi:8-oxo-dGTP pyrophosphatase MutT (NUDIX family)